MKLDLIEVGIWQLPDGVGVGVGVDVAVAVAVAVAVDVAVAVAVAVAVDVGVGVGVGEGTLQSTKVAPSNMEPGRVLSKGVAT